MIPVRRALLYVLMLLVFGVAIVAVLKLGSSLPAPAAEPLAGSARTAPLAGHDSALGHLLLQLLVIIVAARGIGHVFKRFGQPAVVGEMAAGIFLGPSLFGLLAPEAFAFVFPEGSLGTLKLLSQIGVCFFMFTVGMEVDLRHVRGKAEAAVAVSHASILFPYLLGVILAYYLFTDLAAPGAAFMPFALFMGISMSITAFPVLARILQERRLSKTSLGRTALTCAAVGDVTAWTILAFVVAIAEATSLRGATASFGLVIVFVAAMIFGARRVLPRWTGADRLGSGEPAAGVLAMVACVVVGAALATEMIGIHALFGAFLAGVIMPEAHDFRHKIAVRIENFSSVLLLPLFFAFTGLRTPIGLLGDLEGWLLCLLIVVVATLGKLGGSAVAARVTGMSWSEALQLGALMNTRGLMELIALNIGYDLGLLSPRIFAMLVVMALVTTALTGPLLTLFGMRHATATTGLTSGSASGTPRAPRREA